MGFVTNCFRLLLIFGALKNASSGPSVSRIQACAGIANDETNLEQSTYQIKILTALDGTRYFEPPYAYIPMRFNDSASGDSKFSPRIRIISTPPYGNIRLCCNRQMTCSLPQKCAESMVELEAESAFGTNAYKLTLSTDPSNTEEIKRWGVRYYSLVLYYSESSDNNYRLLGGARRANTVYPIQVGLTLAVFNCNETNVKFISGPVKETVRIRRLAFLNGNGGNHAFPIYQLSARLNGAKPNDAIFDVPWHQSWNMDKRFYVKDDLLYMNIKNVSLQTDDQPFTVNVDMLQTAAPVSRLPLEVIARAENRYNPIFSGCKQPQAQLIVQKSQRVNPSCDKNSCPIATLEAKDYDDDKIYLTSLEVIEPVKDSLKTAIERKLEVVSSGSLFTLNQRALFREDELRNWSYAAGPKGYALIRINIRDRENPAKANNGSCVMRINLESLDGVSSEPTFISPNAPLKDNPLQITIQQNTQPNTPILQVLAVDWIVQKLQVQQQAAKQQQIWYQLNSETGVAPFNISTDGRIFVNGSLKAPANYLLRIGASFGKPSRYSYASFRGAAPAPVVFVRVVVVSPEVDSWTPRFDVPTPPGIVIDDGVPPTSKNFTLAKIWAAANNKKIEKTDLTSCILLDNTEIVATCELDNSSAPIYGVKVAFSYDKPVGSEKVTFDYSQDRQIHMRIGVTHKANGINNPTEMGVVLQFHDKNNRHPETYGTASFIIPQDHVPDVELGEDRFMSLFLFDRDLDANGGVSCMATVDCHSVMGPANILSFVHEDQGSGFLRMSKKFNTSGRCELRAEDSTLLTSGSCLQTAVGTLPDSPPALPLLIQITEQPIDQEPVDVFCPDPGIPQFSEPFISTECRAVPAEDAKSMSDVLRDNVYYFITDPTGTFAADPTNGSIYLLQPIILQNNTMSDQLSFTIDVAIFNGRKWSTKKKAIKIANSYLSRPNLVDLYDFYTEFNDGRDNGTFDYSSQSLQVPVPVEINSKTRLLTIVQKSAPKSYPVKRNARAYRPDVRLASNDVASSIEPFLAGHDASTYRLEKDPNELRNTWHLYRNEGPLTTTATTFFRAASQISIVGSSVKVVANYSITQQSKTVTIGNVLTIQFSASSDRITSPPGLAWYWILVIILGFVLLVILGLLILFLLAGKRRKKVGTPEELPGSPVKYAPGRIPGSPMSPTVHFEPSFDTMLANRLQMANLSMTSPSTGRTTDQWHGDDAYDTVTISSGITDTPLNLSVLNQFGPEYTDLAETCGVAKRV